MIRRILSSLAWPISRFAARVGLFLSISLLAACSSDDRAVQGPGSETSGFSARVLDGAGIPVAGVAVRAVALDRFWHQTATSGSDPVVGRAVSDSDGRVRFGAVAGVARMALEIGDSDLSGRVELDALSEPAFKNARIAKALAWWCRSPTGRRSASPAPRTAAPSTRRRNSQRCSQRSRPRHW